MGEVERALEAARTVAEVFRALSARQVEVTFADDFTARISGQDYKSEIEAATKASHWFVILLSDAKEPSGWCMYETGLFRASVTSRKLERLICLHHPNASLPATVIPAGPDMTATLNQLTAALRDYVVRTRSVPKDFEEFAAKSRVTFPPPPAGKKYIISGQEIALADK